MSLEVETLPYASHLFGSVVAHDVSTNNSIKIIFIDYISDYMPSFSNCSFLTLATGQIK
jgi:hypothetical protein